MRISAINNNIPKQTDNKNNEQTSFKGGVDALINFWQFVDNGGRALQFTVEDMFGTNFPRTYKGAMAGYSYTHKINFAAVRQEGIREFLTGPTMCVAPIVILALAKKAGKTVDTHTENIFNLSYLMQQAASNKNSINEDDFYATVLRDLITKTSGKEAIDSDVTDLLKAFKKYKDEANILNNKELLKERGKKEAKKTVAEAFSNLQDVFESIIKRNKDSYQNTDFTMAKYSINNAGKEGATKFKNYVEYITAYAQDFAKKFSKDGNMLDATKENINNFKNSFLGKRVIAFISMFAITGVLMSFIPKIYTWASGGVNPNASAIYDEAGKNKKEKEVK